MTSGQDTLWTGVVRPLDTQILRRSGPANRMNETSTPVSTPRTVRGTLAKPAETPARLRAAQPATALAGTHRSHSSFLLLLALLLPLRHSGTHSGTQILRHSDTQIHSDTQALRYSGTQAQTLRHSDTLRRSDVLDTLRHSDTQALRYSDTQILRHSDTQIRSDAQTLRHTQTHSDTLPASLRSSSHVHLSAHYIVLPGYIQLSAEDVRQLSGSIFEQPADPEILALPRYLY